MAAGLALGAVGTVWAAATVAEVNPLHLALVALLLHRALVWEERRRPVDLAIGGLLIGLAAGNHLLTLFVAPFVVLFVLWVGRRELLARPWLVLVGGGAGLVGLSVYLYIPIAASLGPPLPYNHPTDLDSVLVPRQRPAVPRPVRLPQLEGSGRVPRLAPGALGRGRRAGDAACCRCSASRGWRSSSGGGPRSGSTLVAILVFGLYVWANYLRLEHYLLVPWLILALGAGVAGEWLAAAAASGSSLAASRRPRDPGLAVGAVAVAGAVVLGLTNWGGADRSGDRSGEAYVAAVFAALPRERGDPRRSGTRRRRCGTASTSAASGRTS